jgi:hypothetical protein
MENLFNKLFDAIYCIRYVKRGPLSGPVFDEFQRVGIVDSNKLETVYSVDMPQNTVYYRYMNGYEREEHKLIDRYIHVTMTHYQVIKTAYELGLNTILILEDDIVFLKDINRINNILSLYSDKVPITLFDYTELNERGVQIMPEYHKFNAGLLSSCYALNREGMEYLIYCIECGPMYEIDKYFSNCALNFTGNHNGVYVPTCEPPLIVASDTRICIQTYNNFTEYYHEAYDDTSFLNDVDYEQYNLESYIKT